VKEKKIKNKGQMPSPPLRIALRWFGKKGTLWDSEKFSAREKSQLGKVPQKKKEKNPKNVKMILGDHKGAFFWAGKGPGGLFCPPGRSVFRAKLKGVPLIFTHRTWVLPLKKKKGEKRGKFL